MRRPSDLRRARPRRISGRAVLIALGVVFLVVVVFGRAVARFYIDYLWHDGLGRSDVFWGVIRAKATLFGLFFLAFAVLAGVNLFIADRLAPRAFPANVHPFVERFHEVFGKRMRLVRYGIAGALALIAALPTTSQWQSWMLFRNSRSFGPPPDPQFNADVGFYVFELPFLAFLLDWLFIAMILVLITTLLTHVLNGGVVFASPVPSVRPATKGHIAVLLAILATLKAADYWVTRYETTNERRGFVQGATYAVVNAQLPALMLLMLIALLSAALYLSTLRTGSWRLPLIASALWLVVLIAGGYIYPAAVQSLVVEPNQQSREAPYIERNVLATRAAMNISLDEVEVQATEFGSLSADAVSSDTDPLRNVRLLNPEQMLPRFQLDRGQESGLRIDDLDIDRYEIDGELQQVVIAARELDLGDIANRSWQGRHLINTRGCGLEMAPAGQVAESDRPVYQNVELERPELYFSPSLTGYAIAGTSEQERVCGENSDYTGTAGVEMSSIVRRAAFALAFLDYNVLGSGAIESDSQMLWVRNVVDRLEKVAPFLSYDGDPYPVIVEGRVQWVVDAYTSTSNYPYAQRIGNNVQLRPSSGIDRDANYIRNSVKAVVDAYDGSVRFYVVDPDDPIIQAWDGAFGEMLTPAEEMPDELAAHLRYPEDLFRVQTDVYSKYQLGPDDFFEREGAWSVAQAPAISPPVGGAANEAPAAPADTVAEEDESAQDFASEAAGARFIPYYTLFRNGLDPGGEQEFVLLRPFVPFSRDDRNTQLQAFMTATSDFGPRYGQLTAYVLSGDLPDGPRTVSNTINTEPSIAQAIREQTGSSQVTFGDMQIVPVADGLLYVRPFYASGTTGARDYRFIVVSYGSRAAYGRTLGEALGRLFPGFEGDLGDRVGGSSADPTDPGQEAPDESQTAAEMLAQADDLFAEADDALAAGDLGEYQARVNEAGDLVARALELLEPSTSEPSDEPSSSDPPSSEPETSEPGES